MEGSPAIVVMAHARPAATARLLAGVRSATVPPGTPLVISIDRHDVTGDAVVDVAESLAWTVGPKRVVTHDAIGLVAHFGACGDLSREFGSIVLLEDDLFVGPGFYEWASAALTFSATDNRIAGVSLATPPFDGYRQLPFEPLDDGSDALYAPIPWYDGMAFRADDWDRYRRSSDHSTVRLHPAFDALDDDEWFPDFIRYLVATDRVWMLPRASHATGTGATGAHFDQRTDWFQVPLAARAPSSFRFRSLDDSLARYDDHMELVPTVMSALGVEGAADWIVDLGANRDLRAFAEHLVVTTRPVDTPIRSWGAAMHPLAMNIVHDEPGDAIHLAPARSVTQGEGAARHADETLRRHHRLANASDNTVMRRLGSAMARAMRRG
ncbi:MAG: hypothetical protein AAF567_12675 [Actinomycetota bacterium]